MRAPRTGGPLGGPIVIRITPEPKPTAHLLEQRLPLAPGVDTSYPTRENVDLQQDWQARIEAGLIKVTR